MKKAQKSSKVPFFRPWITNDDKAAVKRALDATILTAGPKLEEFERLFAKFTGTKYAVGVSNATTALQLSLKAAGVGKGDEVIVPDMTFVATANAVIHCGAVPVLVDVEKDDLNISVNSIKKKITKKTRAILPVHFAGKICNIKEVKKIAKSNNLLLIEDCAHAIGARLEGHHVGTFGDAGCFSFYPTKNITTIEGGMVVTNSRKIADYVKTARSHGMTRTLSQRYTTGKPWDYDIVEPGYNFRLDEIRASLGINQLKRIKKLNSFRRTAYRYYNLRLQDIEGITTPTLTHDETNVCHLYIVKIGKKYRMSRDQLFRKLSKNGITATVHYKPLHLFSAYKKLVRNGDDLRNSEQVYDEIISLPFYPQISRADQDKVINCIKSDDS
jgi:dTDP-4-amino-4,6-dideoxygalactose transaminase